MTKISRIRARQLLDCKCRPLVEAEIVADDGAVSRGAAPTGQSVGAHEACVLRDGDERDYHGMSVHRAVNNIETIIAPVLIGMDVGDTAAIDRAMIELDGTPDKHRLGGNAIYSVSIAAARAAAEAARKPLYQLLAQAPISTVPVPTFNMVNGGRFPGVTQSFNEFIVVPYRAQSIQEAIALSVELFARIEKTLRTNMGGEPAVAKSYGFAAPSSDPAEVLGLMSEAMCSMGARDLFCFALDCASTEVYDRESGTYLLKDEQVTSAQLVDFAVGLSEEFDFLFIEDLLDEDDWEGFSLAKRRLSRTLVLGDDLIVTNRERLEKAVELEAVDGFILKPNQVGTITEALDTYRYACDQGLVSVPSGRSGGVIDDVVMDLSTGLQVPFQKNGAPRSGERIEKLNFLMRAAESAPHVKLANLDGLVRF